MFEYIIELISIVISIKILTKIGNYLKGRKIFENDGWFVKFVWWWVCYLVMYYVWAILANMFGYGNRPNEWEMLILFSSVCGFSSRYYGKVGFGLLLIFTFLVGAGGPNTLLRVITAMLFFFITRYYDYGENIESGSSHIDNTTYKDELDLLNYYLLKAKELSSEALEDLQNNNVDDAVKKWNKSLEHYKKAEKIAKLRKDDELISSINKNIKTIVQNVLNIKIKSISDKIGG
ncbi:hypothetical protein [Methanotorris formicicus]|uniref:Uncharacterized protein n=1 Tax=Methanotorris formicicus Mc-S-70 TaxID=647171 RepID=H1L0Z1_9EURY|nr:hypothetical protein [Methanotorris formicicus]EHP84297.1 hypothetical protein MetfoDRAFT_1715 [Methanotorris formicicus Mc-S-70]